MFVKNARKNNKYENSPLNEIACKNEISRVPKHLIEYFYSSIDSSIDSVPILTINKKQEIINNNNNNNKSKREIIKQELKEKGII